jgi:hypothetical protein
MILLDLDAEQTLPALWEASITNAFGSVKDLHGGQGNPIEDLS